MRTKAALILIMTAMVISFNCMEEVPTTSGRISFLISPASASPERTSDPSYLLISMESDGEPVYENKFLALSPSSQGYVTGDLQLFTGMYAITKLLIYSEDDQVLYATPREGSVKAQAITHALPVFFKIEENKSIQLTPKLVGVVPGDSATSFGYDSFGLGGDEDPAEEPGWMSVRIKYEPTVSGVVYMDVDALVTVVGFDESNVQKWQTTVLYTGPQPNDVKLKTGLHHYDIEITKWGTTTRQRIRGAHLWEGRVRDGVVPTTYVFSKQINAKLLAYTITYSDDNDESTLIPETKTSYEYNAQGKIIGMNSSAYVEGTGRFILETQSEFQYEAGRVSKITTYEAGRVSPSSEDIYTYEDDYVTHITHKAFAGTGLTTEVSLHYEASDRIVTATYRASNGGGFEYKFINAWNNMTADHTTRFGQQCSDGVYTHDRTINPLKHVGYTDYLLRNYSVSNPLTENVHYIGCAFPSLEPESHSYIYDADEYPLIATTHYKDQETITQVRYFYK